MNRYGILATANGTGSSGNSDSNRGSALESAEEMFNIINRGATMNKMSPSPTSMRLDIYDDDDDSILTEEDGDINLTQSMQSLALTSSLGEDFLSLFAPG